MKIKELLKVRLNLFDGEGAADAGSEGAQAEGAEEAMPGSEAEEAQEAEKRKAFLRLVDGEYKDVYDQEIQKIVHGRMRKTAKENESLRSQVDRSQPLIDMLLSKYSIEDGDLEKLTSAVESDYSMWEEAADKEGMTVEQYMQFQRMQRENAKFHRMQEQAQQEAQAQAQVSEWMRQAEALKEIYPEFDLAAEVQNPQFMDLIQKKTSLEFAYKMCHFDELQDRARRNAAAGAEKAVVENIRARGSRPKENGTASQSAFTVRKDPSKMTKDEILEAIKQAQRGQSIGF